MLLRVGQAAVRGEIARYPARFDLLELCAERGRLPRNARLSEWREARPELVFSVRLGRDVGALTPGAELEDQLAHGERVARAVSASWIVLSTPASVTPSARHRARLAAMVERVKGLAPRVAWEPHGLWEDDVAEGVAAELDVHLVRDLATEEPPAAEVIYTRLRALGRGVRVTESTAERVADRLDGASEAFVVIEGDGGSRAANSLRELLGVPAPGSADAEPDDDDEDFEDEEEDEDDDDA